MEATGNSLLQQQQIFWGGGGIRPKPEIRLDIWPEPDLTWISQKRPDVGPAGVSK